MDFMEPISYPLKDLKKLLIGGLLIFPGMLLLLIPMIIAEGYTIKAAGDTVRHKDELPEFDDWGYFLMKGLGAFGICIIYGIIICIPIILIVLWQLGIFNVFEGMESIAVVIFLLFLIIAFLLAILFLFIVYIALVRYGEKENIGAAFAVGEIFRNFKANLGNYIIGFIVLIAIGVVIQILMFIAQITIVGILFIGVISFYSSLVWMRMFAQIYNESKEKLGES